MSFNLESYLVDYDPKIVGPSERLIECPLCGKQKLSVNVDKGVWHCWYCQEFSRNSEGKSVPIKGAGGTSKLVELLEGVSWQKAKEIVGSGNKPLRHSKGNALFLEKHKEPSKKDFPTIPFPPFSKNIQNSLTYTVKRGITDQDIADFGLFYCDGGRYQNRLIFPVWDNGRLIYYQARAMWESTEKSFIKTLNPPNTEGTAKAGDVLFNLDQARHFNRVVLTEGPIDAIHVGKDAVCSWGKKITIKQINRLYAAGIRALDLMWDGPSETEPNGARDEMRKAANILSGLFDVRIIYLPWGDPGDYTRDQLNDFRSTHAEDLNNVSRLAVI